MCQPRRILRGFEENLIRYTAFVRYFDAQFVNVTALNLRMSETDRQALLERHSVLARARALLERLDQR